MTATGARGGIGGGISGGGEMDLARIDAKVADNAKLAAIKGSERRKRSYSNTF